MLDHRILLHRWRILRTPRSASLEQELSLLELREKNTDLTVYCKKKSTNKSHFLFIKKQVSHIF